MESKGNVLYVDNNGKSRTLLSYLLEDCGFEITVKADATEALEACRTELFDVVLLAHKMAVMTGPQLAHRIKSFRPGLPVVMISGCAALPPNELIDIDAHFGSETSFDDLVQKLRMLSQLKVLPVVHEEVAHSWADST